MNLPAFTAQASLYRTSNRYHSVVEFYDSAIPAESLVAAYLPGPQTLHDCGVCTDQCARIRNICLAEVAASVAEGCLLSLGFGCGAAILAGIGPAAHCVEGFAICLGYCNIPGDTPFSGPCCPKICGLPNPLEGSGSGCCDLGEGCVDSDDP